MAALKEILGEQAKISKAEREGKKELYNVSQNEIARVRQAAMDAAKAVGKSEEDQRKAADGAEAALIERRQGVSTATFKAQNDWSIKALEVKAREREHALTAARNAKVDDWKMLDHAQDNYREAVRDVEAAKNKDKQYVEAKTYINILSNKEKLTPDEQKQLTSYQAIIAKKDAEFEPIITNAKTQLNEYRKKMMPNFKDSGNDPVGIR